MQERRASSSGLSLLPSERWLTRRAAFISIVGNHWANENVIVSIQRSNRYRGWTKVLIANEFRDFDEQSWREFKSTRWEREIAHVRALVAGNCRRVRQVKAIDPM